MTLETTFAATVLPVVYELIKTLGPAAGFLFGVYRLVEWVKGSFSSLQSGSDATNLKLENTNNKLDSLNERIDAQTGSIVGELKEVRADFRSFYTLRPFTYEPVQARAKKAVKKPVQRTKTKSIK